MKYRCLAILILGIPCLAQAGAVYKCNVKGSTVYQAKPCPVGTTDVQFQREQRPRNYSIPTPAPKPKAANGTSNEIPDTEEGKKKSLAIAQEAYKSADKH